MRVEDIMQMSSWEFSGWAIFDKLEREEAEKEERKRKGIGKW